MNCIHGTSSVPCGLSHSLNPDDDSPNRTLDEEMKNLSHSNVCSISQRRVRFLVSIQNPDGGWIDLLAICKYANVTLENSQEIHKIFDVPSTASQIA
jgi:hypothetical protein